MKGYWLVTNCNFILRNIFVLTNTGDIMTFDFCPNTAPEAPEEKAE